MRSKLVQLRGVNYLKSCLSERIVNSHERALSEWYACAQWMVACTHVRNTAVSIASSREFPPLTHTQTHNALEPHTHSGGVPHCARVVAPARCICLILVFNTLDMATVTSVRVEDPVKEHPQSLSLQKLVRFLSSELSRGNYKEDRTIFTR